MADDALGVALIARAMVLLLAPAVQAQSALQSSATFYTQMNPRALALDLRIEYLRQLGSESSAVGVFGGLTAAPGLIRPTIGLEIQPIVRPQGSLSLGIGYSAPYFFAPNLLQSYPSPRANFGSGVLSGPAEGQGGGYALLVHELMLNAVLQGTIGPFAARNTTRAVHFFAGLHGGDSVLYDPMFDVAVYKDGGAAQNDPDLLYSWGPDLALGLRPTLTLAWYPRDAYSPGEPRDNPDTPISKLGPFGLYRIFESQRGTRGELLLMAQWYLAHRYRTGETVSGAFPLLGVGLLLTGDLQSKR